MVKGTQKRLIKRSLELIGAIAVVYLLLEFLQPISPENSEGVARVRLSKSNGDREEIALPIQKLQKLQEQVEEVKREQEYQKQQRQNNVNAARDIERPIPAVIIERPDPIVVKPNPTLAKIKGGEEKNNVAPVRIDPVNMGPDPDIKLSNGQPSPDLGVISDFKKLNIPLPSLKSDGFLLPMLYFDMGPNNLFRMFRQGVVTAYEMGRSVVVPVFHRHPRMGDTAKNPFVLPIFDTNYTVDLVWSPSETIDTGKLKKVVNIIPMKDFQKLCAGKLNAVVKCGEVDEKRMEGINHFQRAAGMQVEKEITIQSYQELVPNDLSAGIINPNDYKCLGLIYGKKCLPDQDRWLATFSKISDYFWRPYPIRKFAVKFLSQVMHNAPFMAVHWRYESDWLDMCKPSRPKGARERNKEICRITMGLSYDDEVRGSFVKSLKTKMTDFNLQKIYLASPPNNIDLIRLLNESFPGNFYYIDDVMKYAKQTEGSEFITNNYKASFVEQEICFRSTLFLGASLSSWTQTVLTDRLSRGVRRHDSVLEVVGQGAPGFPKLVFQFPEGNFNFGKMLNEKKV